MKKLSALITAAVIASSVLASTPVLARSFTVVNAANYKMTIVAHFKGSNKTRRWYCPAGKHCHLNNFPYNVRNVEIHRYSNPNKYGYYPNRNTTVSHPFHNTKIRCENGRYHIFCHYVPQHH